jgi:hypothetical protein
MTEKFVCPEKFAEILAKATEVFGSQEEAEQWLQRPATGLDQRRPIDLLTNACGCRTGRGFSEAPRIRRLRMTSLPAPFCDNGLVARRLELDQEVFRDTWG